MAGKNSETLFWKEDTGKKVVGAAWTGTKAVGAVVIAGVALGLGLNAYSAASV